MSPDSNKINIQLKIDVPVGAGVSHDGDRIDPDHPPKAKAYTRIVPAANANHSVLPAPNGYGTICAEVTYGQAQYRAWAAIWSAMFPPTNPTSTFPFPGHETEGKRQNGGLLFVWNHAATANPVKWAVHSATGAANVIGVWRQQVSGGPIRFEALSPFTGFTDSTPCGSGSGSGSNAASIDHELACAPCILVEIPDGCHAGRYHATRTATRTWEMTITGQTFAITADGRDIVIRSGSRSISSKAVSATPFLAKFDGEPFESKGDVLVMVV